MNWQSYLLGIMTAGSLAFGAIVVAQTAIDTERSQLINGELTPTAQLEFEALVTDNLCPAANQRLGLAGPRKCTAAKHGKRIVFEWQRGEVIPRDAQGGPTGPAVPFRKVLYSGTMGKFPGMWTAGDGPQ